MADVGGWVVVLRRHDRITWTHVLAAMVGFTFGALWVAARVGALP